MRAPNLFFALFFDMMQIIQTKSLALLKKRPSGRGRI
jgi:hypothetical protein